MVSIIFDFCQVGFVISGWRIDLVSSTYFFPDKTNPDENLEGVVALIGLHYSFQTVRGDRGCCVWQKLQKEIGIVIVFNTHCSGQDCLKLGSVYQK